MKWTKILLFSIGIVFEIFAFVISNSENLPNVFRYLSHDYYRATQGFIKLSNDLILKPSDKGFEEINKIAKDIISQSNPVELFNSIRLDSIICDPDTKLKIDKEYTGNVTNVFLYYSNGQNLNWSMENIIHHINQLKNKSIFHWSIFLVVLGIMFQIWSF